MRTGVSSTSAAAHGRMWPAPSTRYLNVHSSRRPIGPRAWSFWVELPISAPIPNSPPSVKRVEALTYTHAASTPSWNARADVGVAGDDRLGVAAAVAVDVLDRLVGRVDDADGELEREVLGVPVLLGRRVDRRRRGAAARGALVAVQRHAGVAQRPQRAGQERPAHVARGRAASRRRCTPRALELGVEDDRLGRVEVGARVDVHVAVARCRVDHRHGRDALQRRLQPLAAARDDQVDDARSGSPARRAPRGRRRRPATIAPSGRPGGRGRLGRDRGEHRVRVRRGSSSRAARSRCPTSGTARRRRSSRSAAPRRRPRRRRAARGPCARRGRSAAAQPSITSPTGSGSAAILRDARGHRRDPCRVEREPVQQRGASARSRGRPRGRARWPRGSPRRALEQRVGDRLQRGVLDLGAERRQQSRDARLARPGRRIVVRPMCDSRCAIGVATGYASTK